HRRNACRARGPDAGALSAADGGALLPPGAHLRRRPPVCRMAAATAEISRPLPARFRHLDQPALASLRRQHEGLPHLARRPAGRCGAPHRLGERRAALRPGDPMTMQLHYYPSTAAMIPHIVLEELGVPYQRVFVDRARNLHKAPDYLKLNPNGLIPVLVDGD